jgi:hypothetical protein
MTDEKPIEDDYDPAEGVCGIRLPPVAGDLSGVVKGVVHRKFDFSVAQRAETRVSGLFYRKKRMYNNNCYCAFQEK